MEFRKFLPSLGLFAGPNPLVNRSSADSPSVLESAAQVAALADTPSLASESALAQDDAASAVALATVDDMASGSVLESVRDIQLVVPEAGRSDWAHRLEVVHPGDPVRQSSAAAAAAEAWDFAPALPQE